jgi:hypothetical protein
MGALLGFLPFVVFALAERSLGVVPGLAGAALVSVALLLRELMSARSRGEREINILEAGSALLFGALTAWALLAGTENWSVWRVRLWVDGGLMLVVLFGMALRRPFTLPYARRQVSAQVAASPAFLRTNQIISGAWALAFAVLSAADLQMVLRPQTPLQVGVGLTLAALAGAAWFTRWYPARVRARTAALAADSLSTSGQPTRKAET